MTSYDCLGNTQQQAHSLEEREANDSNLKIYTRKNSSRVVTTHRRGEHGGLLTECTRDKPQPGSETSVGYGGSRVRHSHMQSRPHHRVIPSLLTTSWKLRTFRREAHQRRLCEHRGTISDWSVADKTRWSEEKRGCFKWESFNGRRHGFGSCETELLYVQYWVVSRRPKGSCPCRLRYSCRWRSAASPRLSWHCKHTRIWIFSSILI